MNKKLFKKYTIIFFSILLFIGLLCAVQFLYSAYKNPKIEKKSQTLQGFLLIKDTQDKLPVEIKIHSELSTYRFHNETASVQGKITATYKGKEVYSIDFYSSNIERNYIAVENNTSSPSTLVAFTKHFDCFLLGVPTKDISSIENIRNEETALFTVSQETTKDFKQIFSFFPENSKQVNEWLIKNQWK